MTSIAIKAAIRLRTRLKKRKALMRMAKIDVDLISVRFLDMDSALVALRSSTTEDRR